MHWESVPFAFLDFFKHRLAGNVWGARVYERLKSLDRLCFNL